MTPEPRRRFHECGQQVTLRDGKWTCPDHGQCPADEMAWEANVERRQQTVIAQRDKVIEELKKRLKQQTAYADASVKVDDERRADVARLQAERDAALKDNDRLRSEIAAKDAEIAAYRKAFEDAWPK